MASKNTICLWYNRDALEAAQFYAKTFPDSSVGAVHRAPGDFPSGQEGDVLTVEFTVMGIPCLGLNGGLQEAPVYQVLDDLVRGLRVQLRLRAQLRHGARDGGGALEGGERGEEDLPVLALVQRGVAEAARAQGRRAREPEALHRAHDGDRLLGHARRR